MSLTTLLDRKNAKRAFYEHFPLSENVVKVPRLPVASHPLTQNFALCGTAFDYALRWVLKRESLSYSERKWVAESSLNILRQRRPILVSEWIKNVIEPAKAIDCYQGNFSLEHARLALLTAMLDGVYRKGQIISYSDACKKLDKEDCRDIVNLIGKLSPFLKNRRVVLNPNFGEASRLVGGADADLIVDDTLIDIKTTKYMRLTPEYYHQLIGYYLLARLGTVIPDHPAKRFAEIKELGVYFSRHGKLVTFPVPKIEPVFICRFQDYAMRVNRSNRARNKKCIPV